MHACLASITHLPEFRPEPFSKLYQRSLYQSMRTLAGRSFPLLRWQFNRLLEDARALAADVLGRETAVQARFKTLLDSKITAVRIRCHGDYHLRHVLYTGRDFVIVGFEGNPDHPAPTHPIKRSALWDVAVCGPFTMPPTPPGLRLRRKTGPTAQPDDGHLSGWAEFWRRWVGAQFLKSYLQETSGGRLIPTSREELQLLLDALLLERAVAELGHEIQHRPQWAEIPLSAIRQLLQP